MCGIFGFARHDSYISNQNLFKLKGAVMDLAFQNESRGHDGTGLALLFRSRWVLFKEATPAHRLIRTTRFQKVLGEISPKTLLGLGHTRLATIGSVKNRHCHPFFSDEFMGVHNGHFLNRKALLKKYDRTTKTAVDSEAIFKVLDGVKKANAIAGRLEEMEGDFALGFARPRAPETLYLVRNAERPLHAVYVRAIRTLFWSSEARHLEYALIRNGFRGNVWELKDNRMYVWDTKNFNGKSNLKKHACTIPGPKPVYSGPLAGGGEGFGSVPYLFSFDELERAGLFRDSEVYESTKIPCACCREHVEAGKLFYDDAERCFLCENCSFDYLDRYERNEKDEEDTYNVAC